MKIKRVPLKAKMVKEIVVNGKHIIITDFDVKEYGNGDLEKAIEVVKNNLKEMGVL